MATVSRMPDVPAISVIVRCKDKFDTIESTLASVRRQTIPAEIVVVDSGSTDGTLDVAREWSDAVVEIPADEFSYGRSLNLGAQQARAPLHAAVSAHAPLPRRDWLERALAHHEREDVAGACGSGRSPDGHPLLEPYYQALHEWTPGWGFSNTASTWRASVWEQHPFDERMTACEDKEWGWRVLNAGWRLAFDPFLMVPGVHRRGAGLRALYRRTFNEARELVLRTPTPPTTLRGALAWWWDVERNDLTPPLFQRLNYFRVTEVAGTYAGGRSARRTLATRQR